MASNLKLDDALLERAQKLSGKRTKRETVNAALQEFVARRRRRDLLTLFGKLEWDTTYDYKAERER